MWLCCTVTFFSGRCWTSKLWINVDAVHCTKLTQLSWKMERQYEDGGKQLWNSRKRFNCCIFKPNNHLRLGLYSDSTRHKYKDTHMQQQLLGGVILHYCCGDQVRLRTRWCESIKSQAIYWKSCSFTKSVSQLLLPTMACYSPQFIKISTSGQTCQPAWLSWGQ